MKISFSWLRQYTDLDQSPEKISEMLTDCGLEVESLETFHSVKGGLKGVVIGEVVHCEKHPNSDHLSLTRVDIGQSEPLKIVCGAPNVAAGQKVVVATVGATLCFENKEITLQKTKIRGEVSEGMICAEDELGLGPSHDGILVLKSDALVGTPAADYFNIFEDHVFTIGLTPNRSDAASHIGVARDLVAIINNASSPEPVSLVRKEVKLPDISGFKPDSNTRNIPINIQDPLACPRYSGLTMSGVSVRESPSWLKNKLLSIGLRPINNIVDVTNFILMELGQPLHAFDADKINGDEVIIRKYPKGTKFITLDEIERELTEQDLMICNPHEPMCIAGVFGGVKSGVTEKTINIFLESAYFSPTGIRKTARHHGLQTDASFRFERGTDPEITVFALKRAALLIKEIAGGEISSDIIDVYPEPILPKQVEFSFENLDRLIGKKIDHKVVINILKDLGISVQNGHEHSSVITFLVPPFKTDVTREADLIEEVLRIYGYNNIEISSELKSSLSYSRKPEPEKIQNLIADYLVANAFHEIINNSLSRSAYYSGNKEYSPEQCVTILNPISRDLDVMRQTLLFGGLETVKYNQNRKAENLRLFEFGNVYRKSVPGDFGNLLPAFHEEKHLSLLMTGLSEPESWNTSGKPVDFFLLKAYVLSVLRKLGLNEFQLSMEDKHINFLFDGQCYSIKGKPVVVFGVLAKSVLKEFDIKQDVFYADFTWDIILGSISDKCAVYYELPRFPEVRRDLALLIDQSVSFEQISRLAMNTETKLLKKVGLFDVYEGEKIAEGKKSYAITLTLQDETKTLTDQEIEKVMQKIIKVLAEKLNAQVR